MPELKSELIFHMDVAIGEMYPTGDFGAGDRWIAGQTGGVFEGKHLRGEVLTPGGDFGIRRADGVTEHDVHVVLRTDDGAIIYMHYSGVGHALPLTPDQDDENRPFYFRVAVKFETGGERYKWLNRIVAVGVPKRPASDKYQIGWDVYAIL